MVQLKQVFVSPGVATASFEPSKPSKPKATATPSLGLHPSPPHVDADPTLEELQALLPGSPPTLLGSLASDQHYTQVLDALWLEFDEPQERTAGRLLGLIGQVADEALRMHQLSMEFWDRTPTTKVPVSERERYQKEFLAYLKRVKGYKTRLLSLPADSLDTDEVYLGLIKRRDGAGPVPDAIMHMYFANQIGVLSEHAHEMGQGFLGRVMTALDQAGTATKDAVDRVTDDTSGGEGTKTFGEFANRLGMLIAGTVAVVTLGTVAAVTGVVLWRTRDKSPPPPRAELGGPLR